MVQHGHNSRGFKPPLNEDDIDIGIGDIDDSVIKKPNIFNSSDSEAAPVDYDDFSCLLGLRKRNPKPVQKLFENIGNIVHNYI